MWSLWDLINLRWGNLFHNFFYFLYIYWVILWFIHLKFAYIIFFINCQWISWVKTNNLKMQFKLWPIKLTFLILYIISNKAISYLFAGFQFLKYCIILYNIPNSLHLYVQYAKIIYFYFLMWPSVICLM